MSLADCAVLRCAALVRCLDDNLNMPDDHHIARRVISNGRYLASIGAEHRYVTPAAGSVTVHLTKELTAKRLWLALAGIVR